MNSHYRVFVDAQGKFQLVDMRENPDLSQFTARTTSTWKKIVTAGQRRYYSTGHDFNRRPGTYILSYPDKSIHICNPSNGDYIKPGFIRVSRELGELFNGYDGARCVNRSRCVPINGRTLINENLTLRNNLVSIYRNRVEKQLVDGWTVAHASSSYYMYIMRGDGGTGVKCRNEDDNALLSQPIAKETIEGLTRFRIRVHGANGQARPTDTVLIDANILPQQEDGTFLWEGDEPFTVDPLLTVKLGPTVMTKVEVLYD